MKKKEQVIARCELFKTLPPEGIALVAERATEARYAPGQPVMVEGQPVPGLFVLCEGTVDYIKRMDDKNGLVLFRWEEGDVFGLGPTLEKRDAVCSAVAQTEARCVLLPAADFAALCEASPLYEHRLFTQALLIQSQRLRQITLRFREFLAKVLK